MTKFDKTQFNKYGEYVSYGTSYEFVARFKYTKGAKGSFITFLCKNFTVEEYFSRLKTGEAPLTILESKGYLLPHVKKILKTAGYPTTRVGYNQYIQDQIATRKVA